MTSSAYVGMSDFGHDRVAEPPTGHREGLGEPVEHDRAIGHTRQRRDGHVLLAVVQDPAVDLVGHDPQVVLLGELGDPLEVGAGQDTARRVCRRVDDQQLRPRRYERGELLDVQPELVLHTDRDGHRRRADEAGQRFVDRVARIGDDHLVARIDQSEDRVQHHALAADRDEHLRRVGWETLARGHVVRDRLAAVPGCRGTVRSASRRHRAPVWPPRGRAPAYRNRARRSADGSSAGPRPRGRGHGR